MMKASTSTKLLVIRCWYFNRTLGSVTRFLDNQTWSCSAKFCLHMIITTDNEIQKTQLFPRKWQNEAIVNSAELYYGAHAHNDFNSK